jgi:hypothetical protein
MSQAQLVTKITVKTVCGSPDIEKIVNAKGKSIELMDVFGFVRKAAPGSSDMGDYVKFKGSFKAVNLETGEVFESGALILPGVASEAIDGAFTDETTELKFGFRIGVKYAPENKGAVKYSYFAVPLSHPAENDPLVMLENQIKAEFPRLAAPAKKAA